MGRHGYADSDADNVDERARAALAKRFLQHEPHESLMFRTLGRIPIASGPDPEQALIDKFKNQFFVDFVGDGSVIGSVRSVRSVRNALGGMRGSVRGSMLGSVLGGGRGSVLGAGRGSVLGSMRGSAVEDVPTAPSASVHNWLERVRVRRDVEAAFSPGGMDSGGNDGGEGSYDDNLALDDNHGYDDNRGYEDNHGQDHDGYGDKSDGDESLRGVNANIGLQNHEEDQLDEIDDDGEDELEDEIDDDDTEGDRTRRKRRQGGKRTRRRTKRGAGGRKSLKELYSDNGCTACGSRDKATAVRGGFGDPGKQDPLCNACVSKQASELNSLTSQGLDWNTAKKMLHAAGASLKMYPIRWRQFVNENRELGPRPRSKDQYGPPAPHRTERSLPPYRAKRLPAPMSPPSRRARSVARVSASKPAPRWNTAAQGGDGERGGNGQRGGDDERGGDERGDGKRRGDKRKRDDNDDEDDDDDDDESVVEMDETGTAVASCPRRGRVQAVEIKCRRRVVVSDEESLKGSVSATSDPHG